MIDGNRVVVEDSFSESLAFTDRNGGERGAVCNIADGINIGHRRLGIGIDFNRAIALKLHAQLFKTKPGHLGNADRKSVCSGRSVSVSVDHGVRRILKTKKKKKI